jgi:hypothetical protein
MLSDLIISTIQLRPCLSDFYLYRLLTDTQEGIILPVTMSWRWCIHGLMPIGKYNF